MNEKKKQVVLVSVLAVLALGAGSYYMFFRDSGSSRQITTSTGPVTRKVKDKPVTEKVVKRATKEKKADDDKPKTVERKIKEEPQERQAERKSKDSRDRKIEKKKFVPPVG